MAKNEELFQKTWKILYPDGDISPEKGDPEVRRVIDRMYKIAGAAEPDYNEIWVNVCSRSRHRLPQKRLLRYTAVVILPLALFGSGFYFWATRQDQLTQTVQVLEQSKNAVRLTLASGDVLNLTNEKKRDLFVDETVEVQQEDRKIIYNKKDAVPATQNYDQLEVPVAADYCLQLSDGTLVFLNSDSKLKFPSIFAGKERRVFLEGEAYFDVAKDAEHPFRVEVKGMEVEALGTHFNINAYPEKKAIQTTLAEGKVSVTRGDQKVILSPGEQANCTDKELTVKKVDVREHISWKEGMFIFNRMPLEEIMLQIRRWYGLTVIFLDDEIKGYTFTGMIDKNLPAAEIFKVIEKVVDARFSVKDKNVTVIKLK